MSREDCGGEMSSLPCSPAAPPMDDDNLLSEILLRLPPQPSSLPRASLVCKRWRRLVSDPRFTRRFRLHHRRNPPLLGCIVRKSRGLSFVPTMEAPNRVPPRRFSLQFHDVGFKLLNCYHGLVLVFQFRAPQSQVVVWDPITGDKHNIAGVPAAFHKRITHGAVVRTAGDVQHFQFQVVLAVVEDDCNKPHVALLACVYSSETAAWGDVVSMPLPNTPTGGRPLIVLKNNPARMVENRLYWLLVGSFVGFLEFDLERQNLTIIPVPVDVYVMGKHGDLMVTQAEGGGLGLFFLSDCTAQLWKRTTDGYGLASWVLERTIELDKLLALNLEEERAHLSIVGYAQDSNVVFLQTHSCAFMIHLEPLQFKKLPDPDPKMISIYHPFDSVYVAEGCVSGGHDGAAHLLNTSNG